MTHDDERRYHEQQNYAHEFRQRWRSKPDLSAILDAKAEREKKEWTPKFYGFYPVKPTSSQRS